MNYLMKKAFGYGLVLVLIIGVVAVVSLFMMSDTNSPPTGQARYQKSQTQQTPPKIQEKLRPQKGYGCSIVESSKLESNQQIQLTLNGKPRTPPQDILTCQGDFVMEWYCRKKGEQSFPSKKSVTNCAKQGKICNEGRCEAVAVCGNGAIEASESCDDGNSVSNDGCSATCSFEKNYQCSGEPSVCSFAPSTPPKVDILVCLMRWNENDPHLDLTSLKNSLSEVQNYYKENSFGLMDNLQFHYAESDVLWTYPIPSDHDSQIQVAAKACHTDIFNGQSIDLRKFKAMIISPRKDSESNSGYSMGLVKPFDIGYGEVRLAAVLLDTPFRGYSIAHELGHALFNLQHSNLLWCPGKPFGYNWWEDPETEIGPEQCVAIGYGNSYDIMGGYPQSMGHFNGWYKKLAGWIDQQIILSDGTYELSALEVASDGAKVLQIPFLRYPVCIEYRKPIGYDNIKGSIDAPALYTSYLPNKGCLFINMCSIDDRTYLLLPKSPLEYSPQTIGAESNYADSGACLDVGEVFTSEELGISLSFSPSSAKQDTAEVSVDVPACIPTDGVISWWSADVNANYYLDVYLDVQGSNHGEKMGGTTSTTGIANQAFYFDGEGDYVKIDSSDSLEPSSLTVEAWFEYPTLTQPIPTEIYIISHGDKNTGYALFLDYDSAEVKFRLGSQYVAVPFNKVPTKVFGFGWHYIAGTFDGSTMRLYFDGIEVASSPVNSNYIIPYAKSETYIGAYGHDAGYFKGRIDEVLVYDRALTMAEITNSFKFGSPWRCK